MKRKRALPQSWRTLVGQQRHQEKKWRGRLSGKKNGKFYLTILKGGEDAAPEKPDPRLPSKRKKRETLIHAFYPGRRYVKQEEKLLISPEDQRLLQYGGKREIRE